MYGKCCGVQTNIKSRDVRVMVGLKQQILLDGSESGKCVGVERHVYPQTVVSVSFK
jgi:hypothetical protein